jgi:hypothetical protein
MSYKDITGERFGRLVAVSHAGVKKKVTYWKCKCDCGNTTIVRYGNLGKGTKSCGCLKAELNKQRGITHGQYGNTTYGSWKAMKERCLRKKAINYAEYGGRGIKVCTKWKKFENFFADMGHRPEGTTLDRIDPNGNYEKENVRWATIKQQRRNRRDDM